LRKHVSIVRWAAAAALCALGIAVPVSAQITTGTISGSVKDSQGGMVPGATVVLISESRGTKSVAAVTNETGDYVLPNITPDTYIIEISMPGFKTLKRSGVAVSGGDRVAAGALVIEIGGATETVDVTAEAPLIQASSGERSFTVTTSAVENLPLSTRNFASLTQLTPGVSGTTTRLGGGGQNNIMMDGVSTMDTGNNGQMLQMNVEAIAEVKVLTSGYQAEYGRSSGLQITAVTKSGTNRIHGSLYDVERNSDWNENSWVNEKNSLPKTIQKERDWGYSVGGPVGKPGGVNKLFFFYSHEYRPRQSGRQVNRFRVPTLAERAGDFSASTDQNGNAIPNLFDSASGGTFANKTIPADRLYQPGLAILKLWPQPNTTGLNYNYEVELPTVNTLIQQPAFRLDYQPWSAWRLTGKYAGQMRSHELNSIGGAAAPGITARIPGFNDYVEPYPWIGTISVTNNLTLNATTFLEATYGWVQNQLGSMITSPASNRFNAGLGDLPLLFPDAGVIDSRYYEIKPLEASGTPFYQDGRVLLPPTFAWGNRVANAPPNLSFPGFMNVNRTQDFSISLTKVWDRHTTKAGFYLNHSFKAQNLGAGGGASFQGNISFANDTANPLDTGFGFANAALGVFTSYQQQSKFVEGSFIYDQIDWYVQDNWKVNSKLTFDYGLRFVNQRPQYDQYLQSSNFFPERWSAGAAPALYLPGCAGTSPCSGTNRQARNPVTGALLGPNTSLAIGQLVGNSGNPLNGIVKAGDGIAKGNYEWPTIGYAPRFGAAYDLTGSQRFVLRGGAGLFFDRPNGNSVFSQVGNPPFSTATTVRYSQLQSLGSGGLTTQGPPSLIVFKYDSKLPSSYQWNAGVQFALPWSVSGDVSYVGQRGFNLLQNVDINGVDFGVAFAGAAQDATVAASATPGGSAQSVDLLRPYRGFGAIQQNWGIGYNTYHSIQTSFNRRFRNGFSAGLNYTLGLSNTGTAGNPVRLDHHADGSYSIRADQAEQDELLKDLGLRRHTIKGNVVWDLPNMAHGSGGRRILAAVVNDWQLSGILTAGTGEPYSVGFSYAGGAVGNALGGTNANGTGNQNLTGSPTYAPRIRMTGDTGSGCSDNQYAQFNVAAFAVPAASASSPSLGLESGQNYLHGCFDKTIDLALARNFRLGGTRNIQFRIEAFNAFNAVVYDLRNSTLQVTSPLVLTPSNPQYDASGTLVQSRLTPQNAGFGAATRALPMRSMQAQIRFQF
jgi:hypothetical protein